jgi:hypothetical protein
MKSSRILVASLAINLALAATLIFTHPSTASTDHPAPSPAARIEQSITSANSDRSSTPSSVPTPAKRGQTTPLWSQLQTGDDLDQLAARLAEAGFTKREIHTVINDLAGRKFEAERAALRSQQPERPYWKPNYTHSSTISPELRARQNEISQRQSAFIAKYARESERIAEDETIAENFRLRYGDLPLEKLTRLADIQSDYQELEMKLHYEQSSRANQQPTPADREKQRLLETEKENDIRQLLAPEEYAEYSLRESRTAMELRSRLNLLRLTEAEYKALFTLQRPIDEQFFAATAAGDEAQGKARYEALQKLSPQIEAALGPDRYADYQQLMKGGDDQVTRLMSRLELPLATAGKITVLRDTASEQAAAIRSDSALTPAEREIRLATLARETETKLGTLLRTPRGVEAYSELKGDWLRALQPKPAAP